MRSIKDAFFTGSSFLFTECKPLLAFYFSVTSFASEVPTWFFEYVSLTPAAEMKMRNMYKHDGSPSESLGSFLACVASAFKAKIANPGLDLTDSCLATDDPADLHGLGIDLGATPLAVIGYFDYAGLAIAGAMCVLMLAMFAKHRPGYFGGATFIQFTLDLRGNIIYKIFAAALAAFSLVFLAATAFIGYRTYDVKGKDFLILFVQQFAGTVIGLFYSGFAYVLPDAKIEDKYKSPEFSTMTFKRPASDITKDSLVFCNEVSHAALVAAATGDLTEINKYTGDDFTSADDIIKFVQTASNESAESAGARLLSRDNN